MLWRPEIRKTWKIITQIFLISSFKNMRGLKKHIRLFHLMPEIEVTCKKCGKVLQNKRKLYAHNSSCLKEAIHSCHFCDFKHKYKKVLDQHVAVIHIGRTLDCQYCGKEYAYGHNLKLHKKKYHPREWEIEYAQMLENRKNRHS